MSKRITIRDYPSYGSYGAYAAAREKQSLERQIAGVGIVNKIENLVGGKKRKAKLQSELQANISQGVYRY